jgi:hypothetical protein
VRPILTVFFHASNFDSFFFHASNFDSFFSCVEFWWVILSEHSPSNDPTITTKGNEKFDSINMNFIWREICISYLKKILLIPFLNNFFIRKKKEIIFPPSWVVNKFVLLMSPFSNDKKKMKWCLKKFITDCGLWFSIFYFFRFACDLLNYFYRVNNRGKIWKWDKEAVNIFKYYSKMQLIRIYCLERGGVYHYCLVIWILWEVVGGSIWLEFLG